MKKEYIKPDCVEQVLTIESVILAASENATEQHTDPFSGAPARPAF